MQPNHTLQPAVRERLLRDLSAMVDILNAQPANGGQVLERLPDGSYAWLRPEPRNYVIPSRPVLTDLGRRALAMDACFGPWPTVAEAYAP